METSCIISGHLILVALPGIGSSEERLTWRDRRNSPDFRQQETPPEGGVSRAFLPRKAFRLYRQYFDPHLAADFRVFLKDLLFRPCLVLDFFHPAGCVLVLRGG